MKASVSTPLYHAVEDYVDAPTSENREKLMSAADDYREFWILEQASGDRAPRPTRHGPKKPTTTYDRQLEVTRIVDDIPVKLALQERTSTNVVRPWWVVSWRTKYKPGGTNRRFYITKTGCWTIPAEVALEMIDEIASLGALEEEFFDWRRRPEFQTLTSTEMSPADRGEALEGITGPDEDWGKNPFFVINFDPHDQWKKVMIINTDSNLATFRSITENQDYMPKKVLRPAASWWLDNSMMDANVQQMRKFQEHLRTYISSKTV